MVSWTAQSLPSPFNILVPLCPRGCNELAVVNSGADSPAVSDAVSCSCATSRQVPLTCICPSPPGTARGSCHSLSAANSPFFTVVRAGEKKNLFRKLKSEAPYSDLKSEQYESCSQSFSRHGPTWQQQPGLVTSVRLCHPSGCVSPPLPPSLPIN